MNDPEASPRDEASHPDEAWHPDASPPDAKRDDAAGDHRGAPGEQPESVVAAATPQPLWRRMVKPVVILVVGLAVGWIVIGLVGAIDWSQVWASLARLSWWQVLPLAALLLVRQTFNAVPLTRFVPGLSLWRSLQNDVSANLVGTIAPPPGDVVLRVSMFRSWSINPVDGMAGVTLNMLAFYVVRFLAPVLGILVLAFQGIERGQVLAALGSAAIAAGILVALYLIAKGDALAAMVGRSAGRVVRRFRRSVDPDAWAMSVVDFRGRMVERLRAGLPTSLAALAAMVLTDAVILLVALRFVGVGSDVLGWADVVTAFLVAYPLTLMPLFGFGVLDAALVAAWVEIAGIEWEPELVAGLAVWRVTTIAGPLALGALTVLLWRRRNPESHLELTA